MPAEAACRYCCPHLNVWRGHCVSCGATWDQITERQAEVPRDA